MAFKRGRTFQSKIFGLRNPGTEFYVIHNSSLLAFHVFMSIFPVPTRTVILIVFFGMLS